MIGRFIFLILSLLFVSTGCTLDASLLRGQLSQNSVTTGSAPTTIAVTGDNDTAPDTVLKASPVPKFTWDGEADAKYQLRVLSANGKGEVCEPVVVIGSSTTLSTCELADHNSYKVEITPLSSDLNPLLSLARLFDFSVLKLRLNYHNLTLLPGEKLTFSGVDGTPALSFADNGSNYLNPTTLEYSVPLTAASQEDKVSVTDAAGTIDETQIKIQAFSDGAEKVSSLPKSASYATVKDVIRTQAGTLLATSISESAVYMDTWITFRSTDDGRSWKAVDIPVESYDYESYGNALAQGPDGTIYGCGSHWPLVGYGNDWMVRKSTDDGLTWVTTYRRSTGDSLDCRGIAVSANNYVYTIGLGETNDWQTYESKDGGQTFTLIDSIPGFGVIIKVDSAGNLWTVGAQNTYGGNILVRKGTFNTGTNTWDWTNMSMPTETYKPQFWGSPGQLIFASATEFYFAGKMTDQLKVIKSTDSGATWTVDFARGTAGEGFGITKAKDGSLIASGSTGTPKKAEYFRKSAGTWSQIPDANTPCGGCQYEGGPLLTLPGGDIVGFLYEKYTDVFGRSTYSTDNGLTWSTGTPLLWGQIYDIDVKWIHQSGNKDLWVSAETGNEDYVWGNSLHVSSDEGKTWRKVHENFDPAYNYYFEYYHAARDNQNNFYITQLDGVEKFLVSNDNAATWTEKTVAPVDGATPLIDQLEINFNQRPLMIVSGGGKTEIRESTDAGASWTAKVQFPITVGATSFTYKNILLGSNQKIYLTATEVRSGTKYVVVYKSDVTLSTWVELVATPDTSNELPIIKESSTGEIYLSLNGKIQKSSNQGSTWQLVEGDWPGIKDFIISVSGRIFAVENGGPSTFSSYMNDVITIDDPYERIEDTQDVWPRIFQFGDDIVYPFISVDHVVGGKVVFRKLRYAP